MMQNGDISSDQQAHIVPVSDEGDIQALIKPIRGVQVILDRDVARLYGVATGALNRQVKRNEERFPKDFMFRLSAEEWGNLKCQIVISSWGGDRQLPYAFTENGIAMLTRKPNLNKKYPGLFFPGKDDKGKNKLKCRARVDFSILKMIADWRVKEISV